MYNALKHIPSIRRRIERDGSILLLDFDGTLSPIVAHHRAAKLPIPTRTLLRSIARRVPVIIISGRGLTDLRSRARIPVSYIGSHGLETHLLSSHTRMRVPISRKKRALFLSAQRALADAAKEFAGVRIERKYMSLAVHYRKLSKADAARFRRKANSLLHEFVKMKSIRALDDLCTFDIMPTLGTKGTAALAAVKTLQQNRRAVPVYIGDSSTDEDAFRSLKKGITIRVGRKSQSVARFFVPHQRDVHTFLQQLYDVPTTSQKRTF